MNGVDGPDDRLTELAHRWGIAPTYIGSDEREHVVAASTIVAVLAALGVTANSAEAVEAAITDADQREWRAFLPVVTVVTEGGGSFSVHVPHGDPVQVYVVTESGQIRAAEQLDIWVAPREIDGELVGRATFAVPADLEPGYHRLKALNPRSAAAASAPLIVTPARLDTTDALLARRRWGLAIQLYSIRSARSWGVGDFGDLGEIAEIAGGTYGADFVQVNPLHAAQPAPPLENSPYLPTSRRFLNPLYIRMGAIPELAGLRRKQRERIAAIERGFLRENTSTKRIKRDKSFRAKMDCLELVFDVPLTAERAAAFEAYRHREGKGLRRFATWCALAERYGPDDPKWRRQLLDQDFVKAKRVKYKRRIDFHMWLQWICDEQLAAAQQAALAAGMSIGVIADLAVGVARHGADAWTLGDVLAGGVSVGAPPDAFNQQGQNWSQPPWHPRRLADVGYEPYRDMLRTVLRHAGGLRVDHVLGLFRLWWIPDGASAADGAYVHYDHDALIGILALEAQRAGAVVIGEDLGVFERSVQDALRERGILGTSILWFEHGPFAPIPPEDYRALCLTSVTTHDLPPTAGYLAGDHITLRAELGLLESDIETERARDTRDREAILELARARGLLGTDAAPDDPATVDALYALIARSPSALLGVALVDAVGERRTQNQPGTDADQYPNWCIPLADADGAAVLVEDLASNARFAHLVELLAREGL
ncbi:4-alpha-glucanotransferase [Gordonia sp. ABSL1-1]|uniref:4-alpha-glucanotransferase n=1 Tax=Gordonia sp. ABSL1-1 TaxID=3053923 RepID=UPI0025741604|nr:4-alpha-glucanotransferase [Gordonia sp. ABSL1-1]MDL9936764.1 4-alpha-glucanotransferase [Gordonia sp. ABSL1-1]